MSQCSESAATAVSLDPESLLFPGGPILSPEQRKLVLKYLGEGSAQVSELDSSLEPTSFTALAERVCRVLDVAKDDKTPKLLLIKGTAITWVELILWLTDNVTRAMNAPGARVEVMPEEDIWPLQRAMSLANDVRDRLQIVIEGNGSRPEVTAKYKAKLFKSRIAPRSRPTWQAELRDVGVVLEDLDDDAPPGLAEMLADVHHAYFLVSRAVDGQKIPKPVYLWSREVHAAVRALALALGDLLSWAAGGGGATRARRNHLRRIIAPRHQADGTRVLAGNVDAPPAEDEIIDSPDPTEEEMLEVEDLPFESAEESVEGERAAEESAEGERTAEERAKGERVAG